MHKKTIAIIILLVLSTAVMATVWLYKVDKVRCNGCGACLNHCPEHAITMVGNDAYIDPEKCTGCGDCVPFCPRDAIIPFWYTGIETESGQIDNITPVILFPNPAYEVITITGLTDDSEVSITDISGRTILEQSNISEEVSLDISDIPAGTYLLFINGNQTEVRTFEVLR